LSSGHPQGTSGTEMSATASKFWRSAAQYFASGVGLVLVTFVCVRFGQDIHVAVFGYLILIVLLALTSEFTGSLVLSVAAAGCLTYFFAPSLLSFRIDDLEDATTIAAFLTISFFVNGLIIQRKRAEDALRRSESYLAETQRLSHTGTIVFNAAGPVYWSEESYRIWGLDPLQGLPNLETLLQRIYPEDRDRVNMKIVEALHQQTSYAIEFRIVRPDESVRHLEFSGYPLLSRAGALEMLATHFDVTERKRAQAEHERLLQLESDLAHLNRLSLMGELAASLAHEILHPIATARNNARVGMRLLEMRSPNLEEVKEALGSVVSDIDRAKDIVGQMRDHIKKAPPRREPFDVNEAIREVIVMVRRAIDNAGVSVSTSLQNKLRPIRGDRVQLQQVIVNLILNSVEAMNSHEDGARTLSIRTEQSSDGILVAVHDSGPGINPGNLDRVFEAFYTTKTSGVGMGLSICRSIVNGHGGRLWASAGEHRGAVFQFILPATQDGS
jgi:signal transduction histidine kinase